MWAGRLWNWLLSSLLLIPRGHVVSAQLREATTRRRTTACCIVGVEVELKIAGWWVDVVLEILSVAALAMLRRLCHCMSHYGEATIMIHVYFSAGCCNRWTSRRALPNAICNIKYLPEETCLKQRFEKFTFGLTGMWAISRKTRFVTSHRRMKSQNDSKINFLFSVGVLMDQDNIRFWGLSKEKWCFSSISLVHLVIWILPKN